MGLKLRCSANPEHPEVYHNRVIAYERHILDADGEATHSEFMELAEYPPWSEWRCLTCEATVLAVEEPDAAEECARDSSVCSDGGEHMPDYDSVSHERGMGDVLDVCCAKCGLSGSFRVPNADIMW